MTQVNIANLGELESVLACFCLMNAPQSLYDDNSQSAIQQLCFVHGHGQNSRRKYTTKSFVGFHNH